MRNASCLTEVFCLFSNHFKIDFCFDLLMDIDNGGIVAYFFNLGTIHNNFFAVDVVVMLLLEGIGNLDVVHCTEEPTLFADLGGDADTLSVEGGFQSFSILADFFLFLCLCGFPGGISCGLGRFHLPKTAVLRRLYLLNRFAI